MRARPSSLLAQKTASRQPAAERKPEDPVAPYPEPDVTLSSFVAPRFELSFLEQPIPGAPPEVFAGFELGDQRFALAYLRVIDERGAGVAGFDLKPAFAALKESLEADADPGLAANLALEALCSKPFPHLSLIHI